MKRWRSITHGTCALNGKHTNPKMAAECPVLRRQKATSAPTRRSEAPGSRTPGKETGAAV